MAEIDPRLLFQVKPQVDVASSFSNLLSNIGGMDAIQANRAANTEQDKQRVMKEQAISAANVEQMLKMGDTAGAINFMASKADEIRKQGGDPSATLELINTIQQNPRLAMQRASQAAQMGRELGFFGSNSGKTAGQRERESLIAAAQDPNTSDVERNSALIALGITPRAVGNAQQTIAKQGTAKLVGESESLIAQHKELGKLAAQLKLEPEVKAAVTSAVELANATAKINEKNRSNSTALSVYEAGISGLTDALENTTTGPFVGFFPALSSSQQMADGAVAAMAPILKQMFRSAGEGNFTDSDQKLLLDMIPTRTDRPDSIIGKLKNIDTIVRAKLNEAQPQGVQQNQAPQIEQPQQNQVIRFDAQGNIIQ